MRFAVKRKLLPLLMVALVATLLAPIINLTLIEPEFKKHIVNHTEEDAKRLATHLASELKRSGRNFTREGISDYKLVEHMRHLGLWKLKIFSSSGETIHSSDASEIGKMNDNDYFINHVAKGQTYIKYIKKNTPSLDSGKVTLDIVEAYVPVMDGALFEGAFEIYYDITGYIKLVRKLNSRTNLIFLIASISLLTVIMASYRSAGQAVSGLEKTERELARARDTLELEVENRTSELQSAYDRLVSEMDERILAESEMKKSLAEKEVLLRELHHRVKNNMQVITSLITLQSRRISSDKDRELFKETVNRIKSMSMAHEELYMSEDVSSVDICKYLQGIELSLMKSYEVRPGRVDLKVASKNEVVDIGIAVPCGLLVTELVSNALKHAFPDGKTGSVTVAFGKNGGGQYELSVSDDGVGFGKFTGKMDSLGLTIINALVDQLDGSIDITSKDGTTATIRFPAFR